MGFNFKNFFTEFGKNLAENKDTLSLGGGLVVLGLTVVGAIASTHHYDKSIDRMKKEAEENNTQIDPKKVVISTAIHFTPVVAGACLGGGLILHTFKSINTTTITLGSALAASEARNRDLLGTVKKNLGIDAKNAIENETLLNQAKTNLSTKTENDIIETDTSKHPGVKVLFYDPYTDRIFRSTHEMIRHAETVVTQRLQEGDDVSRNDFYEILGLPVVCGAGDRGWSCYTAYGDNGMRDRINIDTSVTMLFRDAYPCIVLNYKIYQLDFTEPCAQ